MRSTTLILVKHASPVLTAAAPPRDWVLSARGEAEADRLAQRLREFLPFRLVSSSEPKALRTAEIVGAALGVAVHGVDGLREIDRPPLPIVTPDAHRQLNAAIFAYPERPALGTESARDALDRFSVAIEAALGDYDGEEKLVVIAHGTVIALFVAAHNTIDAFTLWSRLDCAAFVVLHVPTYQLIAKHENLAQI
jgi:broad specificity phosphatase PhoE